MRRSFLPARGIAWAALLLAGSCALPELTIDSSLDDEDDESDGGTAGDSGGSGANGGSGAGTTGGKAGEGGDPSGGSEATGGASGSDQGGRGGTDGATGGGGATGGDGGKGGASGGSGATGGCSTEADCDADETCCSGRCVNTDTDRAHCGACGTTCPAVQDCSSGRCGCASGLTYCAPDCVNTMTAFSDCGGCDSPCGIDQTCAQGACTGPCGTSFAVTATGWVTTPGTAGSCWRGYAFVAQNAATVTPMNFSSCGANCMLCIQGTVNRTSDFSGFAMIGVNLNQPSGGANGSDVVPPGNALEVSFTNSTGSPLRVQLEGPTNTETDRWCADLAGASPQIIPYSSFRTNCWETTGVAYNKQPLRSVSISVPGGGVADTAVGVCLMGFADR